MRGTSAIVPWFARAVALLAVTAVVAVRSGPALGQTAPEVTADAPACPPGNLLQGKRPRFWTDIRPNVSLPTDGVAAPEGAVWDAPLAAILDTGASTLTWDLGAVTKVTAGYIQADANDYYTLWGSLDGRDYKAIGRIEPVDGQHGLRARKVHFQDVAVRYLRFGEGQGDSFYSLSEIQVFCQLPTPFPPKWRVDNAPVAKAAKTIYTYWNDVSSARWELVLALLGLGLLHWGYLLGREGRPDFKRKLRDRALAVLGVLAALTYVNFGFFHFGNFTHDWEWTHYYVGSKYFDELSYDRLYECIAVADSEENPALRRRVELRKMTNLRTNVLEPSDAILKAPEACKQHFSSERWTAFKNDVRFFRDRQSAKRWDDLQTDHGYNGTPVWNIAGTLLSNAGPATKTQLYTLAMLDPAYLLATFFVVWWAFGWRTLAVGLLVFATNFPSRFYWTGGAFLRWDWLFYLVAAICCLKKDRPVLGGMALAYATALRIFPAFVFLGPLLGLGYHLYKHRRWPQQYTRFVAGAALATVLLGSASLVVSGGVPAYRRFVQNTIKHKETPLTNYMGLRTVIAWRPREVGRILRNDKLVDPWSKWKAARIRAYETAKPLFVLVALGFIVLLGLCARHVEPWAAAALGVMMIPIGAELTCYYYAFLLGAALLYAKREYAGRILLLCTAFTQFAAWAPIPTMATWLDEQYTLMSAGTLVAFALILASFRRPSADPALPSPQEAPPAPAANESPKVKAPGRRTGNRRR